MKKVLLVEDEVGHAQLLKATLEKAQFSVDVVSEGMQGIVQVVTSKPDLILIDIMLTWRDERIRSAGAAEGQ